MADGGFDWKVRGTEVYKQRISGRTEFMFVRVHLSSGEEGWGEATFNALNGQVLIALQMLSGAVAGRTTGQALGFLSRQPSWKNGRAFRIAVNSLELAIFDALARTREVPMHELLGTCSNDSVICYANINRGTSDRTPSGWAKRAGSAVADGFKAVKLAPFDEVEDGASATRLAAAEAGMEALGAVRRAIGESAALMIDCHWRFDQQSAGDLIRQASAHSVEWIEGPVIEDFEAIPDLLRVRAAANANRMSLAGGEYLAGVRSFRPFLGHGAFDVINPDVRFCGILGMAKIASLAAEAGTEFAPHNHLGPVMTAASLQAIAVAPACRTLEIQHAEGGAVSCLSDPAALMPVGGVLKVPNGPGLGILLDVQALTNVRM